MPVGMIRFPVRPEQPENTLVPIVVTLLGIIRFPVRLEQSRKEWPPIVVSAPSLLNVMEVIFVFPVNALSEILVVPSIITMAPDASGLATTVVPL